MTNKRNMPRRRTPATLMEEFARDTGIDFGNMTDDEAAELAALIEERKAVIHQDAAYSQVQSLFGGGRKPAAKPSDQI